MYLHQFFVVRFFVVAQITFQTVIVFTCQFPCGKNEQHYLMRFEEQKSQCLRKSEFACA